MKNNKYIKIICYIIILGFIFFIFSNGIFAQKEDTSSMVELPNPLPGGTDINILIGQIINGVLGVVGSLALIMFVYGGFTWMTAAGSNEKVTKGKDILVWATIGLIVIFMSYAFVRLVLVDILGG